MSSSDTANGGFVLGHAVNKCLLRNAKNYLMDVPY